MIDAATLLLQNEEREVCDPHQAGSLIDLGECSNIVAAKWKKGGYDAHQANFLMVIDDAATMLLQNEKENLRPSAG